MHRLVTFLGTGAYKPTVYALDGHRAPETPWIALALQHLLDPPPTETVVLATEKATEKNGERLERAFREAGLQTPRFASVREGRNPEELWDQFRVLRDELRVGANDAVTVDITHALRHQPFFAAGIIGFARALDEAVADMRVVYGAFELGREGVAPVLELTPFIELADWIRDLVLFLKSGRVSGLAKRAKVAGRQVRKDWALAGRQGKQPKIRELAEAVEAFARDLQTIRTGSLLLGAIERGRRQQSSARRLLDAASAARAEVERHMPPLADVLDRIEAMAKRLDFDGDALVGDKARDALAALAKLYVDMGRYVEAITLLREARITAYAPPAAACPGLPEFDDGEREFVDRRLWHQEEPDRARTIAEIRNDIDHAGFRRSPKKGADLIRNIESQRIDFDKLAFDAERYEQRVLVNISNHGWQEWEDQQKAAALRLVGRVEDIPFPQVNPAWTLARIESEADRLAAALPRETTHALIQGEFTLTMALVRRLQARGIRCLAATTERRVERTDDGRELRDFRFVRFRDYPLLV